MDKETTFDCPCGVKNRILFEQVYYNHTSTKDGYFYRVSGIACTHFMKAIESSLKK